MFRARVALVVVLFFGLCGLGASCNRQNTHGSGTVPGADVRRESRPIVLAANAVTDVPNLDLASLNAAERELFWAVANDELSPCGDPHSLAACGHDNTCALCLPGLRFLARRVTDGFAREQLGELVRARYARSQVVAVRIENAPARGAANAPVTLVEFSDYECPHCGRAAPILRDIEREFETQLRVIHMHFPLSGHPHAMPAARAAVAAGRQGHFWEYHDRLFANQHALEQANLETYARELQLDINRFRADLQSPETEAVVAANRREGERLQIDGTPTVYINGRRYPPGMPFERAQLREWIQEEVTLPRVDAH